VDNARERGDQALRLLRPMLETEPGFVRDVRGKGLMIAVEFDTPEHAEAVQWAAFQKGLLVLECGKSAIRMSPPLTVTSEEIVTGVGLFLESVREVRASPSAKVADAKAHGALTGVEAAG
jgi:4-aminobutyrate aminotransferase